MTADIGTAASDLAAKNVSSAAPLFYRNPMPLTPERHGKKSLARQINFRFARPTNSVPLNIVEFALAQRSYPIVFTASDPVVPVALLGLRDEENLFVGRDGRWEDGVYAPAYMRRYPFVFMTGTDAKSFVLCIDEASEFIVDGDENPLFKNGQPTEATKNALAFCSAFQAEFEKTQQFCRALSEQKLFETKSADIGLAGGKRLVFGAFRAVNEANFNALPDSVVSDWHKRGWLGPLFAHTMSFANWGPLTNRVASS